MAKKPHELLEKDVEKRVGDYAKELHFITYKFTSPSKRSVPDRLFISDAGLIFFIEFKRLGAKTTSGQDREIARLTQQLVPVFVVDNVEYGKQLVDAANMGLDMRALM